jgi:hypothetical protein
MHSGLFRVEGSGEQNSHISFLIRIQRSTNRMPVSF